MASFINTRWKRAFTWRIWRSKSWKEPYAISFNLQWSCLPSGPTQSNWQWHPLSIQGGRGRSHGGSGLPSSWAKQQATKRENRSTMGRNILVSIIGKEKQNTNPTSYANKRCCPRNKKKAASNLPNFFQPLFIWRPIGYTNKWLPIEGSIIYTFFTFSAGTKIVCL